MFQASVLAYILLHKQHDMKHAHKFIMCKFIFEVTNNSYSLKY